MVVKSISALESGEVQVEGGGEEGEEGVKIGNEIGT